MTATYDSIATTTLTTGTTQVDFNTINQNFTDLVLVIVGNVASDSLNPTMRFNGDSGTNYSSTWVAGSGSTASSSRLTSANVTYLGALGSAISTITVHFMNYANTTTNKTALVRNSSTTGSSGQSVSAWVDLWRSTAAITSISLISSGGNQWQSGTTFTLYGIKAE